MRLGFAAGTFKVLGWVGLLYACLLIPAALWDGFPLLQFFREKPLALLLAFLSPVGFIIIGRDLASKRRRGAIAAAPILMLSALRPPVSIWSILVSIGLGALIIASWRELE